MVQILGAVLNQRNDILPSLVIFAFQFNRYNEFAKTLWITEHLLLNLEGKHFIKEQPKSTSSMSERLYNIEIIV